MRRTFIVSSLAALLLSACVVVPSDQGMVMVPPLPVTVQLDAEPYYYQRGYYYFYDNSRWRYSHSRSGPWSDLPRSHYPKETRFRGRSDSHDDGRRDDGRRDDGRRDRRDDGRDRDRDRDRYPRYLQ